MSTILVMQINVLFELIGPKQQLAVKGPLM